MMKARWLEQLAAHLAPMRSLVGRVEIAFLVVWIGLAGTIWGFLALGSEMREGELSAFDLRLLDALRRPGQPHVAVGPAWLSECMRDFTALGGLTLLTLLTVLSVGVLLAERRRIEALVLAICVPLAQLSSGLFKDFYERTRPSFAVYGDLPSSMSFPSGHSTTATAAYFILAVVVSGLDRRRVAKVASFSIAVFLSLTIGVSRVYLGVHWPSDVIAGWCLGATWALTAAIVLRLARRQGI